VAFLGAANLRRPFYFALPFSLSFMKSTGRSASVGANPNSAAFSRFRIARQERHTATPPLILSPHAGHSAWGLGLYNLGSSRSKSQEVRRGNPGGVSGKNV